MKSNLIVFRGQLSKKSQFGVGKPIEFPDGTKGIIRSIIDIEIKDTGDVFDREIQAYLEEEGK